MTSIENILNLLEENKAAEAMDLCQQTIKEEPENPVAHYLLAMALLGMGENKNALAGFLKAGELAPTMAPAHYNAGVLLFEQNRFQEAASSYGRARDLEPEDPDICFNLAIALKEAGELKEAADTYHQVLELTPDDTGALYNLAMVYKEMADPTKAITTLEQAVNIDPVHVSAHNNLAYLHHRQGNREKALTHYQKVAELDPEREAAQYMMAALRGETPETAPPTYVQEVFDSFTDYDQTMTENLAYNTPAMLRDLLNDHLPETENFTKGVDLGCGTGLSGAAFRHLVTDFTGIDLSTEMLGQAEAKNIYDEIFQGEITSFLNSCQQNYNLFLATDVFVYLGDLAPVFKAVQKKSQPESVFLFSTEKGKGGFTLQATGRYAHAESYIRKLADEAGFKVLECRPANIRKEKGKWIKGNLYIMQTG